MKIKRNLAIAFIAIPLFFLAAGAKGDTPQGVSGNKVLIVPIDGEINYTQSAFVRRALKVAEKEKPDLVIFEIDTPGGEGNAMLDMNICISNFKCPTVSYIRPGKEFGRMNAAYSAGVLIAMSAKRIYMYPGSVIGAATPMVMGGGAGPIELPPAIQEKFVSAFREKFGSVAQANGYPKNLAIAMVDKDWEVYEVSVAGKKEFLTMEEIEKYRNEGKNVDIKYMVIGKGKLLTANAEDAVRYDIAKAVITDRSQIYKDYGIQNPQEISLEFTWSEDLVGFVTSPIVSTILLVGGILGIWLTIKLGAFGIPTVLGILCLSILFFGENLAGLADAPAILIFVAGVILIATEIFVLPGTLVPALLGIILVFAGLIFTFLPGGISIPNIKANPWITEDIMSALTRVLVGFLGAGVVFLLIVRFLPKMPLFGRLVLATELSSGKGYTAELVGEKAIIGKEGISYTMLRPAGKIEIDGKLYDVVSDGDFIGKDEKVKVVEVEGTRIVVKRIG